MNGWNVVGISKEKIFMGDKGFELDMFKWEIIKLPIGKDCLK